MYKYSLAYFLFFILAFSVQAQSKKDLISVWDGGEAFDGMYNEKKFLIEFSKSGFHIQYGPNHYKQYTGYTLKKDVLTITRSERDTKKYQPCFRIIKLDSCELTIEAINWAAVYITNYLSQPYLDFLNGAEGDVEQIMVNSTDTDLTREGVLRTSLSFKRMPPSIQ